MMKFVRHISDRILCAIKVQYVQNITVFCIITETERRVVRSFEAGMQCLDTFQPIVEGSNKM
jgi:hypothetical protein